MKVILSSVSRVNTPKIPIPGSSKTHSLCPRLRLTKNTIPSEDAPGIIKDLRSPGLNEVSSVVSE